MAVSKAFINAETVTSINRRWISFLLPPNPYLTHTNGSFNVLMARLCDMSYPDFLRMARQDYNATLRGKVGRYITMTFEVSADCQRLTDELNRRWNIALNSKIKSEVVK